MSLIITKFIHKKNRIKERNMDEIKNIKYLLKDINVVRKKYEEREKNQDNFNLFTILRKEHDEVYLHSRFLSALLDPKGPHRLGTIFLDLFLDRIESGFEYDEMSIEVYPNNQNRSEYKEIDICFIDRVVMKAVIIENKIRHEDTNHEDKGQLENYYDKLIEEDKIPEDGIDVYYLTPDGHKPSEDSVRLSGKYPKLQDKVKCISYSVEILDWLRDLVKECYNKPSLRESVIQYIKLIESMTNNDLSLEEIKELSNLIGQNEENLQSARVLLDNFIHIRRYTIDSFWIELIETLENEGLRIVERFKTKELKDLVHTNNNGKDALLEIMVSYKNELKIRIKSDFSDGLHWGIYNTDIKSETIVNRIKSLVKKTDIYKTAELWYLWKTFKFNVSEKVHMREFDNDITYELILPQRRKEVVEGMKSEIMDFVKMYYEL